MKKAGITDVAKLAGVGIGTVSRALNGRGYVAKETKEKIEQAAKELGYTPNELARNLSRKRSGIIGVIIPDLENPFWCKFIKYVEMELHRHDYKTMVCNTVGISNRERQYVDMLGRNIMDGIITAALSLEDDVYLQIPKPIVSVDHNLGPTIPLIHSDHENGGKIAAECLLAAGCKNVAQVVGYFQANTPSNDRYIAFERTMKEHGAQVQTIQTEWNKLDYAYYMKAMEQYMDVLVSVDGIFSSDLGALSMYHMAIEHGIQVPGQLKIVGYDGMDITRMVTPVLTAVVQDVELLSKLCVETLLKVIDGAEDINYHQVVDVKLQKGETV